MNNIARVISQSIKESKWLKIKYNNASNQNTSYWFSVKDIDVDGKILIGDSFNETKMIDEMTGVLYNCKIHFENILSAEIIKCTTSVNNDKLIKKIEENISNLEWLEFDQFSNAILDYTKACLIYDQAPYQEASTLVPNLDEDTFKNKNEITLDLLQIHSLTKGLEKISRQTKKSNYEEVELAINLCAISTSKGMFVVAYQNLVFDPSKKTLSRDKQIHFNYEFCTSESENYRHNIKRYLDIDTEYFINLFSQKREKALKLLHEALPKKENLDSKPYVMDIKRKFTINYDKEFNAIRESHEKENLSTPLKAFFGDMNTSLLGKKRHIELISIDEKLNIDQLRVMYNAIKQPITYVQGPPGTGKTHSIINLLVSALNTKQTVLVSSNNNKPIDDIFDKLRSLKYRNKDIPAPIIRLGNNDHVYEALELLKKDLKNYAKEFKHVDLKKINDKEKLSREQFKQLNEILSDYESRKELEEQLDVLSKLIEEFKDSLKVVNIQNEYDKLKKALDDLPLLTDEQAQRYVLKADYNFLMMFYYSSIHRLSRLESEAYSELYQIIQMENKEDKVKRFNKYLSDDENLDEFLQIFPIVLTTNLSAPRLGTPKIHFDLTIIDEASQCSIGGALFPIIRGERLLLVGDQNQLTPVVILNPLLNKKLLGKYQVSDVYSYIDNSIIKVMINVDIISKFILLRYHYRCAPKIIHFSNVKYYGKKLIVETVESNDRSLQFIDVKDIKKHRSNHNVSDSEANAIVMDILRKGNFNDIGIITPFRNQVENIKLLLKDNGLDSIPVGTIHTFQGDEKNVIYLSACVTPNTYKRTFNWLKNNKELINVAMTRAKKNFILVGDKDSIMKHSNKQVNDYLDLFNYVISNGSEISFSDKEKSEIINSSNFQEFNTEAERELLTTIKHLLSTGEKYFVRREVPVNLILNKFDTTELFDFGLKSKFDFVIFKKNMKEELPVLVIELNGPEHYLDEKVKARDNKKQQICETNNIKLLKINNDYARRYDYVKKQIIELL